MKLAVKRLHPDAILPARQSPGAAGYDLHTTKGATLAPGEWHLFNTGIAVAIPLGWYGKIEARSGLAVRGGIDKMAGVIDSDFRGPIGVCLINLGSEPVIISSGARIAQLIIQAHASPEIVEVDDLPETERGTDCFGSTGA
jgi:dUTP pyrophosphatase